MEIGFKRISMLIVTIIMLLTLANVVMADGFDSTNNTKKVRNCGENYEWMGYDNGDGTFTLVGCNGVSMYVDGNLELPSYIEGKKVTRIEGLEGGDEDWSSDDQFSIFSPEIVTKLIIPDTVEYIHGYVFDDFYKLKSIVFPNNEKFYDRENDGDLGFFLLTNDSFENSLEEVTVCDTDSYNMGNFHIKTLKFHEGVEDIRVGGDEVPYLTDIVFPSTAKSIELIGSDVWHTDVDGKETLKEYYFDNFMALDIPEGVEVLEIYQFRNLEMVNFPSTLKELTLKECDKIKSINLPISTEEVWLGGMTNLTTLTSMRGIKNVNIYSAYDCPVLKMDLYFHNINGKEDQPADYTGGPYRNSGITSMNFDAGNFYREIEIYKYVNEEMKVVSASPIIAYRKEWFRGMKNLKAINVTNSNNFYSIDGVLYWSEDKKYKNEDDLLAYPAAKSTASNYIVPSWVKCIYAYALHSCKFTSITIQENAPEDFYWDDYGFEGYTAFEGFDGKLRVVKYSAGTNGYDTKSELANYLRINSNRIEFYKGSKYSITYQLNGGKNNVSNPKSYVAGEEPITLKNPTRKGYIFCGWKRNDVTSGYENTTTRNKYFKNYIFKAVWTKGIKTPKIKTIKKLKGKKIKFEWKKIKKIKGYEVEYSSTKNFKKSTRKLVRNTVKSITLKKLKMKKTYYIHIRAYKVVNGEKVYGRWSKIKKIKISNR